MDKTETVRLVERVCDLRHEVDRASWLESPLAVEQRAQVGAVDIRRREVEKTVLLAGGECGRDVRVDERRSDLRLTQEALPEALVARELRRQHLQCHTFAVMRIHGAVDGARRACADDLLDPEPRQERAAANLHRHLSASAWQAALC